MGVAPPCAADHPSGLPPEAPRRGKCFWVGGSRGFARRSGSASAWPGRPPRPAPAPRRETRPAFRGRRSGGASRPGSPRSSRMLGVAWCRRRGQTGLAADSSNSPHRRSAIRSGRSDRGSAENPRHRRRPGTDVVQPALGAAGRRVAATIAVPDGLRGSFGPSCERPRDVAGRSVSLQSSSTGEQERKLCHSRSTTPRRAANPDGIAAAPVTLPQLRDACPSSTRVQNAPLVARHSPVAPDGGGSQCVVDRKGWRSRRR
jgi:hypothetical protein